MEDTRATEENIVKYYNVLKSLYAILQDTNVISMNTFSVNHNVSKNISTILQSGGIIKLKSKGRYAEWEWIGIEPTREMSIKVLKEFVKFNPARKRTPAHTTSNKTVVASAEKHVIRYDIRLLFGLITIKIKPVYRKLKTK